MKDKFEAMTEAIKQYQLREFGEYDEEDFKDEVTEIGLAYTPLNKDGNEVDVYAILPYWEIKQTWKKANTTSKKPWKENSAFFGTEKEFIDFINSVTWEELVEKSIRIF